MDESRSNDLERTDIPPDANIVTFNIQNEEKYIVIHFNQSITSLAFTPDDAARLGRNLISHAKTMGKRKRGKRQ